MLKESETYVHNIFMQSPVAICVLKGEDYTVELANDFYLQIIEKGNEFLNRPLFESLPELKTYGVKKLLDQVMQSGIPYTGKEMEVHMFKGEKRQQGFFNFVYQPIREYDTVTGIMVVATEITDLVFARKKLEESEAFNRTVLENSPDCVKILDAKGRLQFMNINGQCALQIGDFTKLKNKYLWELWGDDSCQMIKDAVTKALNGEKTQFQAFNPTVKRIPKWWDVIISPLQDVGDGNNSKRIIAVSRDITEQKQAAKKIKESEERFRSLADNIPLMAFIIEPNPEATVSYWNKTWLDYTGQTFNEALGRAWYGIIHPDDMQGMLDVYDPAFENREPFILPEIRIKRYDGEYRWHTVKGNPRFMPGGEFMGYIGVGFDVHERKLAEEMIRYRTTLLEAHNEASIDGILLVDAKGKILSYNQRFTEIWNMPQEIVDAKDDEAALAFAMTQLVNPQQFIEKVKWLYAHPTETTLDELEYKDGKIVERYGYPVIGEDGTYYAWSWTFRDVSEKKKQEKRIKESEAHFRLMANLMPAKISNADINGNVLYFNNKWLEFTGLNFEELKNLGYYKIIHPDELNEFQNRFQKATETGTDLEMEMRFINKDGEYKWHLNRASPMKDENGNIKMWIGVTSDIQKIKDEEARKDNFIKMVSHELKTPVTSIKGYVQYLLMMLDEKQDLQIPLQVKNSLVRIDSQVLRLTRLITEMLDLTRLEESKLSLQKELFKINELVIDTVKDIRYTSTKHTINIFHDFTCNIYGDKDRIGQILINFIGNAIKYSPGSDVIQVRIYKAGKNEVAVSVQDYGIGIDKSEHKKIFERFYRVEGKVEQTFSGFGIGLFIANAIIEKHDGLIKIESQKGEGSVFTFVLPIAPDHI